VKLRCSILGVTFFRVNPASNCTTKGSDGTFLPRFAGYAVWYTVRGKNFEVMLRLPMMWLLALANYIFFLGAGSRVWRGKREVAVKP
jgi:hypothetical protein